MLLCCEKDVLKPIISDNKLINSWIEDNMTYYYLWKYRIDAKATDKDENPEQYFKRFIVPEDNYSYITNDFKSLLSDMLGNKKSGYAYLLYSIYNDSVVGKITYVVKESPADVAGLKRGAIFTKINGTGLSIHNYRDLTTQMLNNHTLTVRNADASETEYDILAAEYAENPVFLDTVYNFNGCKVGYLIYNLFISDNGDFSREYDILLNDAFAKFKNENINELILDLRYNTKGNLFNSMIMASLIVPHLDNKEIFAKYQYNKSLQQIIQDEFGEDYLNLYYTNAINNNALNNIGAQLDKIFILTSTKTGVMGEILINGLKLSMNVVIVGNKTAGRNMFSILLYEQNPEKQRINTWAIAPVVTQISNKDGNTDIAFFPDVEISEPLHDNAPLGSLDEKVLSTTLNLILSPLQPQVNSTNENIIPQQLPVYQLQNLSINNLPTK
jgi:C-terminal processing protease CtpA/Prc